MKGIGCMALVFCFNSAESRGEGNRTAMEALEENVGGGSHRVPASSPAASAWRAVKK